MHYYEIWVASQQYHGDKPLTYSYDQTLPIGTVVIVPMQRKQVLGIVAGISVKPAFKTRPVSRVVSGTPTPPQSLMLMDWMSSYYPAPYGQLMGLLLPSTLMQVSRSPRTESTTEKPAQAPPTLTDEQSTAVKTVLASGERMHLLHGDTGSGKTRVYIELISQQLKDGKSAIVLTPEIGLTPQLVRDLENVFPGQTVVIHSNLTPAQRRNTWLRVLEATAPLIVVGPRSALFAPLQNLGLIVLDEAHDSAYKQEQAPYYLTNRVAAKLAELHDAKVILGTATPLVSDYFALSAKNLPIIRMSRPAIPHDYASSISVVNLRDKHEFTRSSWLSDTLLRSLDSTLKDGAQALIFLNRRGTARLVLCKDCGWQAACPRCDLPLTYHGDTHAVRCHTCGFSGQPPSSCPTCNSADIVFRSIGTKSLETELKKLYPEAVIQRFDSDNTKSERIEQHYQSVHEGKVDILIGTQLLAKGLDLPRLGLVGVVVADTSLYFPDYTAEERTYQLVTQVIGRANRGHRKSSVVIQTYHPENETLIAAIDKDYQSMYRKQLIEREQFGFPPFRYALKIRAERASPRAAQAAISQIVDKIGALKLPLEVIGPAPCFVEKTYDKYRWQIIIKAKQRSFLLRVIDSLPGNIQYDIDPLNLL